MYIWLLRNILKKNVCVRFSEKEGGGGDKEVKTGESKEGKGEWKWAGEISGSGARDDGEGDVKNPGKSWTMLG